MLTIWTNKIKHSTVGSSFSVTFSVAPNELEYLNKLYDCFSSMNWSSFPITTDRNDENSSEIPNNSTSSKMEQVDEPQTCDTCKYGEDKHRYAHICNECGVGINNYEPKDEPQTEREGE